MLLQSTGLGNSINALTSLSIPQQLPFLMIISPRASWASPILHGAHGKVLRPMLDLLSIQNATLYRPDEVSPMVDRACRSAFRSNLPVALILSEELTGGRTMNRLEATRRLLKHLSQEIVVANLATHRGSLDGGDRPQNYYSLGTMGMPSSIGLGLALAQPDRKVVVLDGDGSLLMNMGPGHHCHREPSNLIHIVWDNAQYQLTEGRPPTPEGGKPAAIARGGYNEGGRAFRRRCLNRPSSKPCERMALGLCWPGSCSRRKPAFPWTPPLKHNFMRWIGTPKPILPV